MLPYGVITVCRVCFIASSAASLSAFHDEVRRRSVSLRLHKSLLQPTCEVLQPKGEPRLLNDLPQHRLAPGRKTRLQAIAPCHEIVDLRPGPEGVPDRQEVCDKTRPLAAVGIVEPALVSIHAIA